MVDMNLADSGVCHAVRVQDKTGLYSLLERFEHDGMLEICCRHLLDPKTVVSTKLPLILCIQMVLIFRPSAIHPLPTSPQTIADDLVAGLISASEQSLEGHIKQIRELGVAAALPLHDMMSVVSRPPVCA